ncbi:MAG TPA: YfiR family protein [Thermoanaerobaculia bacterium]|nr:YfiR family protein [Thermoanaerobaculia bacterium]
MALLSGRSLRGAALAAAVLLLLPAGGRAAERPPVTSEYAVKAAFLYNFAKFVEWPADAFRGPRDPMVLCLLGEDPFGRELDQTVGGKTVLGRQIMVRRLETPAGLEECRILFVSSSEGPRFAQVLAAVGDRAVLTVGDEEAFGRAGGIISFVVRQSRVRFHIDRAAAARAGLSISSQLLELAETVTGGERR